MSKRDFYKILDVAKTATEADIKKAYRRLAMKFHPDRNPGDNEAEEKFKEAKLAAEVLGNAQQRATYDQYGHAGLEAAAQRNAGQRGADAFNDIFGDVFGDIFGGGRRGGGRAQVFRGADLRYEIELELDQAVFGHSLELEVPKLAECETCLGSGAAKGSQPVTCDTCQGPSPATPVRAMARCASHRAFSNCNRPVRAAAAWARSCSIPAIPAWARGACDAPRNWR